MERINCACGKATWINDFGEWLEKHGSDERGFPLLREHNCKLIIE